MINKHLILDKAIEQTNNSYNDALANNDNANAKEHQLRMQTIMQIKDKLESYGELNSHFKIHNHSNKGR